MTGLHNKRLLLGVSGGIAAYKSAYLARLLVKAGAQVRVVMTRGAEAFIQPLTFQAITGNPVHTSLLSPEAEAGMGHIELARWAELIIIAPTTADLLARLAAGRADDLLTTLCLATKASVHLAPAMNQAMWQHPATQNNLKQLAQLGYSLIQPGSGEQACGDVGLGRLPEPEELLDYLEACFKHSNLEHAKLAPQQPAAGLRFMITAGPTQEPLDPVRYLSNHSSGKMGYALAQAAANLGASVELISGPVSLQPPQGVQVTQVVTAQQMLDSCKAKVAHTDIFIACAAVADYRATEVAAHKIKKTADSNQLVLTLTKNPDILASLAQGYKAKDGSLQRPFCVGFAAETQNLEDNARTKLVQKNLDALVANDVSDPNLGFGSDDNKVILFTRREDIIQRLDLPRASKHLLAQQLLQHLISLYKEQAPL